eukprot:TRINITY_DN43493_c0_g1_i1.p4 TRINITY_DN43493_c0_g1~~TRINITY_DN43493_c0_g1_i1.p4  ORF type:complete len:105 (-),score=12.36 TRINITY_DN43493_c0_g1_i1:493-807(-)
MLLSFAALCLVCCVVNGGESNNDALWIEILGREWLHAVQILKLSSGLRERRRIILRDKQLLGNQLQNGGQMLAVVCLLAGRCFQRTLKNTLSVRWELKSCPIWL